MSIKRILECVFATNKIPLNKIFVLKKEGIFTFINPYSYHLVRKNIDLFASMDGIYVDGILLCKFCDIFYNEKVERRSFDNTSYAKELFSWLNVNPDKSIYFIGATDEEVFSAIEVYKRKYPAMNILGYRSGFFKNELELAVFLDEVVEINPSFVVVGMGTILQENVLLKLKRKGFKGVGFSCGGFIRQSSGGFDYFPHWINKFNLRAFYRLIKEKGTVKRLYNVLFQFPILFIYDFIKFRKK